LKTIILERNPFSICLQESHLKPGENFRLRGYNAIRHDVIPDQRARGGVITFIKENIHFNILPIQTQLQVVAITIQYPMEMTICNLYLPNADWTPRCLRNLLQQLPEPFMIVGRPKCEGTYINFRSNNLSQLDLTICSPPIAPSLKWSVKGEWNTDHLPIFIDVADKYVNNVGQQRWILQKADWHLYRTTLELTECIKETITEVVDELTQAIQNAAQISIPRSKETPMAEIWDKIRAIKGKGFCPTSPVLMINGEAVSGEKNIAEEMAIHFESTAPQKIRGHLQITQEKKERNYLDFETDSVYLITLLQLEMN
ncbi:Endonuclease/exonuclease/phosphatase superfamily, partial [Gonioctena quinquepunctata]